MTRYESGRRYEWAYRALLRRDGWTVARTAGSKSPIDLFYWMPGDGMLFATQAKRRATCKEADRILAVLRQQYPGWCEVLHRRVRGREVEEEYCSHFTEDR